MKSSTFHIICEAGRPNGPTWFPTEDFLNNTSSYLQNKFVNIGFYPNYLWLYKEYLTELRRQLVFKDHLKANVSQEDIQSHDLTQCCHHSHLFS